MSLILLSAFEPFGGEKENSSKTLLHEMPDSVYGSRIKKVVLPVVYGHAFDRLEPLIEREKPDFVIMLGEAQGRTHLSVEQQAINLMDSKSPDNLGNIHKDDKIIEGGPDALFATIPVDDIVGTMRNKKIPADRSYSAGTYVCNDLFYRVLHYTETFNLKTKAGFIHVPALPAQAANRRDMPSMSTELASEGLMAVFDKLLRLQARQYRGKSPS